jgi:hypothetical protein
MILLMSYICVCCCPEKWHFRILYRSTIFPEHNTRKCNLDGESTWFVLLHNGRHFVSKTKCSMAYLFCIRILIVREKSQYTQLFCLPPLRKGNRIIEEKRFIGANVFRCLWSVLFEEYGFRCLSRVSDSLNKSFWEATVKVYFKTPVDKKIEDPFFFPSYLALNDVMQINVFPLRILLRKRFSLFSYPNSFKIIDPSWRRRLLMTVSMRYIFSIISFSLRSFAFSLRSQAIFCYNSTKPI